MVISLLFIPNYRLAIQLFIANYGLAIQLFIANYGLAIQLFISNNRLAVQGPDFQSIVILTSSLRVQLVKYFMTL